MSRSLLSRVLVVTAVPAIGAVVFWFFVLRTAGAEAQPLLPVVMIEVNAQPVAAELATTDVQLEKGLMGRHSLNANDGMLFVFQKPERLCFWMKNTLIPLSIAFISTDGEVVSLAEMQPMSEVNHCAARDAIYALEMPSGWFAAHGILPGMKVKKLPAV